MKKKQKTIVALMYDFDVEAGDTISLLSWLHFMKSIKIEDLTDGYTITDLVVDKVEMVDIEGLEPIKRLMLYEASDPDNKRRKFYIYERFGSLCGWTFSDFAKVEGGGGNTVLCVFDADGETSPLLTVTSNQTHGARSGHCFTRLASFAVVHCMSPPCIFVNFSIRREKKDVNKGEGGKNEFNISEIKNCENNRSIKVWIIRGIRCSALLFERADSVYLLPMQNAVIKRGIPPSFSVS